MSAVAFLGLGRMGAPMAERVAHAGHPLSVWNRTPRPNLTPAGARACSTPALVVRDAAILITMLADGDALDAVLSGPDGLLAGAQPGAILIDMSTIGPAAARRVAARCAEQQLGFLDAPVSGSVPAARGGTLLTMVGGAPEHFHTVLPVLAAMTSRQLHLGPVGAGATMKLAINLMLATTNEAIAELLSLTRRAGISQPLAYEALSGSAVASPYVGYKREAFVEPETTPTAFSVALMRKDVGLALDLARELGCSAPAGQASARILDAALAAGLGEADLAAVLKVLATNDAAD